MGLRAAIREDFLEKRITAREAMKLFEDVITEENQGLPTETLVAQARAKAKPNYVAGFDAFNEDQPKQQELIR